MQTNLSTIFRPTIRHGSLNNAYANIGSPFRGDGQKIGFFIRSTKANSPFFFLFFFFRFTPFLPPLFSAPGKCDSWPATFRLCPPLPPLPVISKKQRKIELPRIWSWIEMATILSRFCPSLSRCGIGWLSFDSNSVKNSMMIVPLVDFVPRQS